MNEKINVAILGATGAVGQRFIQLLENHPYFNVHEVCGFSSIGKKYEEVERAVANVPKSKKVGDKTILPCKPNLESQIIFSAIPAGIEGDIEKQFATEGYKVYSNTRDHRYDNDVPLMIAEINAKHFDLIKAQKTKGYIVTNPNCSTIGLVLGIHPIYERFGIESLDVTTMQAVSGAGYPGVPSLDIMCNVIPYISGEEEKIEKETLKIMGQYTNEGIRNAEIDEISASCSRVPTLEGHMIDVKLKTKENANAEDIKACLREYSARYNNSDYPSAPKDLIKVFEENDRPQPRLDVDSGNGMTTSIGRVRQKKNGTICMSILTHNTIRGAAGCSIINAEYAIKQGYI